MNKSSVVMVAEALEEIFSQENPTNWIGAEEEYLLVFNETGKMGRTFPILKYFKDMGWKSENDPQTGELVQVIEDYFGVIISSDAGLGTLEIIFPPYKNIYDLSLARKRILAKLIPIAQSHGMSLLGLGILPNNPPERKFWQPKQRYLKIIQALDPQVDWMTVTASTQTHMTFKAKEAPTALNTMLALSGPIIAMFANAKIVGGKISPYSCFRELTWELFSKSERVGIPKKAFEENDLCDIASYYLKQQMFVYEADTESHRFERCSGTFESFLRCKKISDTNTLKRHLSVLLGTVWLDTRITMHGTLESRTPCKQPQGEENSSHALCVGLMSNFAEASDFVKSHPWVFWRKVRKNAIENDLLGLVDGVSILSISEKVLEIAKSGLRLRGLDEEYYLKPLEERLSDPTNIPAQVAEKIFREQGLQALVEYFKYK
jgi:gamma-glutamylcysteine synthetase